MPVSECLAEIGAEVVYSDPAGRWVIRSCQPGDEPHILALFQRVFRTECSRAHWQWKYEANPLGRYALVVETTAGALVGHYGGVPVRIAWDGRTLVMPQITDAMLDPAVRRGLQRPGVFAPLVNQYIAGLGHMAGGYGFPTPEHLRAGKRLAGFVPLGPVPLLSKSIEASSTVRSRGTLLITVYEEKQLDDAGVDDLWKRCGRELPVAVIRDASYLRWRYLECPNVKYHVLIARRRFSGTVVGLAVLRLGWQNRPVACLVDWLVPSDQTAVMEVLLAAAERLSRAAGMESIHAWFPPLSQPYGFLLVAGFCHEPTPYELVALSASPSVSLEWAKDRWYYAMGDSDIY